LAGGAALRLFPARPAHGEAEAMAEPSDRVIIGNLPADFTDEALKTNFEAYGTIKWFRLNNASQGQKSALIEFSSVEEATWLVENLDGNIPLGLEAEVSVKYKPAKGGGKGGGGGGGMMRPSPYPGGGGGGGMMGKGGKGGMMMGMGKGGMMMGMGMMGGAQCTISDLFKGLIRHKVLPGGTWANDERTAVIHGLPSDTTEGDVLKIFCPFGAVLPGGVRVTLNEDGTAKGSAMVNFMNIESTQAAIETLNNCMMPDGRFLRVKQWANFNNGGGKGGKKGGKKGDGSIAPASADAEG